MSSIGKKSLLTLCNILSLGSLAMFACGFFGAKPYLTDLKESGMYQLDIPNSPTSVPFDKIVFMVVDALRSDFVYSENSGFSFTRSLVQSGEALPFTMEATSPTFTRLCIQSMTVGASPAFSEVFSNTQRLVKGESDRIVESWLGHLKATGRGKMTFSGEENWLNLFPKMFDRSEGYGSHFLPDFTSIDPAVAMFIDKELKNDDWSGLVVHFPGIDHLAHMGGAYSPYMQAKQREMDDVVNNVYRSIQKEPHLNKTLLVLLGDHGMNDLGEHGGDSVEELSTALLFISPQLQVLPSVYDRLAEERKIGNRYQYFNSMGQLDIVPTISGLLGLPVPRDNLGSFIPDFLPLWKTPEERRLLILQNIIQLSHGVANQDHQVECENSTLTVDCLWEHIGTSRRGHNVDDELSLLFMVIDNPDMHLVRKQNN
ncbi:hypothetical protein N7508_008339 [Penicillium antarcticum]|uniref:uncharacterized protein n=1 Tax=Penicillium antarcticum TaxID=416450 RepID=UPI0023A07793|nr:uncharacterized protein N7508_008339 [Penicillium antarcticum]KAJ5298090.1 hypothetical protein N7508_008339 [Penicillium antarcticum]